MKNFGKKAAGIALTLSFADVRRLGVRGQTRRKSRDGERGHVLSHHVQSDGRRRV